MNIIETLVRRGARSFLLKKLDGKKTYIFRAVQFINALLVALFMICPHLPQIHGAPACNMVELINGQWLALSVLLGQLGLEFGIVDAKIKAKYNQ